MVTPAFAVTQQDVAVAQGGGGHDVGKGMRDGREGLRRLAIDAVDYGLV